MPKNFNENQIKLYTEIYNRCFRLEPKQELVEQHNFFNANNRKMHIFFVDLIHFSFSDLANLFVFITSHESIDQLLSPNELKFLLVISLSKLLSHDLDYHLDRDALEDYQYPSVNIKKLTEILLFDGAIYQTFIRNIQQENSVNKYINFYYHQIKEIIDSIKKPSKLYSFFVKKEDKVIKENLDIIIKIIDCLDNKNFLNEQFIEVDSVVHTEFEVGVKGRI